MKIKQKILIPICISLLICIGVSILGINFIVHDHLDQNVNRVMVTAQKILSLHLEDETGEISILFEKIATNPDLQRCWLAKDRSGLLAFSLPIFDEMRAKHHVTHFYFHQADAINFLRIHNPERFGDTIDRFTLGEAIKRGVQTHGIELGPFGTLTLRVVQPWLIDGRIAGFIELGEELPFITEHLKIALNVELLLTINKKFLSRENWEEGRRMTENPIILPWDSLTDKIVVDSTMASNSGIMNILLKKLQKGAAVDGLNIVSIDGRNYTTRVFPLHNAARVALGDMYLFYDSTEQLSALHRMIFFIFSTTMLLGFLLAAFFYYYLGKLERSINLDQEEIKRQHLEAQQRNELLKHEINERSQAEDRLQRSHQTLTTLNQIQHLALESENLDDLLQKFISCLMSLPWLSLEPHGAAFLIEDDPEVLVLKAHHGLADELQHLCSRVPFGKCLCGRAALNKKTIFANCIDQNHDIGFEGMHGHGHYCIPILSANKKLLGVFTLYVKENFRHDEKSEKILLAAASTVAGTIERLQSIHEKKTLETRLLQAQKMEAIGTLAGGIAHDFNNILTPIIGFAEMVLDNLPPDSVDYEDQKNVIRAALRAKDLVSQILLFSRQAEQEHMPVDVNLIAREVIKLLRASLPANIEIQQNLSPQRSLVMADPTQIHQIIMNLCTNAYHAMRDQGGIIGISITEVNLRAGEIRNEKSELSPGPYLKLEVCDTGHGMTQKTLARIFDPYFTTKEFGHGTGLGLAVVLGIVKTIGGLITVYSEPDNGSTFHIYLPLMAHSDCFEETSISEIPTGNERILIVDDREEIAQFESQVLEKQGYTVTYFSDSITALAAFEAHPTGFDLVITDMSMPKMSGAELAQKIMACRPAMPIVLCTGFSELINKEKARAIGIKGYIMKPIITRQFALIIRDILDGKDLYKQEGTPR